jgi:hypothetical protein
VSTKRKRGHTGSIDSGESTKDEAATPNRSRATRDRGGNAADWCLGISSSAAARCECEPGLLLAEAVSRRAAGGGTAEQFLPVKVADDQLAEAAKSDGPAVRSGTMEITLPKGSLRVTGVVDVVALRAVLERLVG